MVRLDKACKVWLNKVRLGQLMSEIISTARRNSRVALAAGLYISSIMIEVSKVRLGKVRLYKARLG